MTTQFVGSLEQHYPPSHFRLIEAKTGQQALDEVVAQHPDVMLLDLGLPEMRGLDVIRKLHGSGMGSMRRGR